MLDVARIIDCSKSDESHPSLVTPESNVENRPVVEFDVWSAWSAAILLPSLMLKLELIVKGANEPAEVLLSAAICGKVASTVVEQISSVLWIAPPVPEKTSERSNLIMKRDSWP